MCFCDGALVARSSTNRNHVLGFKRLVSELLLSGGWNCRAFASSSAGVRFGRSGDVVVVVVLRLLACIYIYMYGLGLDGTYACLLVHAMLVLETHVAFREVS